MHVFTEEEFKAIEADSAKRFDGRTLLVELPEFDASIVVAPFDRPGYATHADNEQRDQQTAYHGALLARLLWPDFAAVEKLRQSCAMLSEHVALELSLEAGLLPRATVRPLDLARPPAGLGVPEAAKLAAESKAKLWSVEKLSEGLSCVMACPSTNVWLAARTLYDDANRKSSGIIASMEPYLLGAVVWSREPLVASDGGRGLLDLKPGLFWALRQAYLRMGGDGATVRRKSLRDVAQPAPGGPLPPV